MKVIKFAPGLIPVFKHQQHDQSSHGSWAGGSVSFKQDRNSLTMQDKNGNTLASVNFVNLGNNRLDINSIDSFDEGKGYATKVLEKLYSSFPEHSIFWGKTILPASTHLAQKFSDKYGRTEFMPWGEGAIAGYEWGELYGDTTVKKHEEHDQKTHGSWATDGNSFDAVGAEGEILMAEWRKKYRILDKYLESKGMTHSWKEIEADPTAKKMRAEVDAVWEQQRALSNKFYEEHFEQNETEDFDRLRDKYVVADTPTLKMNRQLREGGGLTQRVKDADAMCAMGVVKERVGVYRGAVLPQEMVDSLKVGTSFVDKGFQSTDVSKTTAEGYAESRKSAGAEGTGVIFRMTLNKGLNAVDVSYGEIVVQRNATMTVTKKSKSGDWTIIDVEVSK